MVRFLNDVTAREKRQHRLAPALSNSHANLFFPHQKTHGYSENKDFTSSIILPKIVYPLWIKSTILSQDDAF
jgi:hypothetical protein